MENHFSKSNEFRPGFFPETYSDGTYGNVDPPQSVLSVSKQIQDLIEKHELFWSSESDSELSPIMVQVPEHGDPVSKLKSALALDEDELLKASQPKISGRFLFWDNSALEAAVEYLVEEEGVAEPSENELWEVLLDGDGTDWDLFDEEESEGFEQIGRLMTSSCVDTYHFRFDWDSEPEKYTLSPMFWGGFVDGFFVGVTALRVWT